MKRYENGIHAGELKRRNGLGVSEVKGLEGDIMQCYFHLDEWEKFCWKGWEDKKSKMYQIKRNIVTDEGIGD